MRGAQFFHTHILHATVNWQGMQQTENYFFAALNLTPITEPSNFRQADETFKKVGWKKSSLETKVSSSAPFVPGEFPKRSKLCEPDVPCLVSLPSPSCTQCHRESAIQTQSNRRVSLRFGSIALKLSPLEPRRPWPVLLPPLFTFFLFSGSIVCS